MLNTGVCSHNTYMLIPSLFMLAMRGWTCQRRQGPTIFEIKIVSYRSCLSLALYFVFGSSVFMAVHQCLDWGKEVFFCVLFLFGVSWWGWELCSNAKDAKCKYNMKWGWSVSKVFKICISMECASWEYPPPFTRVQWTCSSCTRKTTTAVLPSEHSVAK